MKRMDLIEYGEISRTPINKNTLIEHWIRIKGNAFKADNAYNFIYWNGAFYEPQQHTITKYGNNKYISEVKLVRYL